MIYNFLDTISFGFFSKQAAEKNAEVKKEEVMPSPLPSDQNKQLVEEQKVEEVKKKAETKNVTTTTAVQTNH